MDPMKEKRANLQKMLGELETAQTKMRETPPTESEGEAIDKMVEEAAQLQAEIKAHDERVSRLNGAVEGGRKVADPVLPAEPNQKRRETAADGDDMVGFLSVGAFVAAQEGLRKFIAGGSPKTDTRIADLGDYLYKSKHGGPRGRYVPVSRKFIDRAVETKAVPTIGADVIEPARISDFVRVTEQDMLTLRDVLNVSTTNSDAVAYNRLVSYTRAAATVAHGSQKPEAAMELDTVTETVRTVAVWTPVNDQQLADFGQLRNIIDTELRYDVDKHLEELIMYGDGIGQNFEGIIEDSAVLAMREESGDTLIDIARRGITDVRRAGGIPNAIVMDPLDFETIVLEKGSDNRYVWVVVTEGATHRLWGVPVIETVAMEDFEGNATEERNMVVGDFARGATLWDRMQTTVSVGWINDQFIRNQRTILAELRAAFGIKRPGFFRKHVTQEAVAS